MPILHLAAPIIAAILAGMAKLAIGARWAWQLRRRRRLRREREQRWEPWSHALLAPSWNQNQGGAQGAFDGHALLAARGDHPSRPLKFCLNDRTFSFDLPYQGVPHESLFACLDADPTHAALRGALQDAGVVATLEGSKVIFRFGSSKGPDEAFALVARFMNTWETLNVHKLATHHMQGILAKLDAAGGWAPQNRDEPITFGPHESALYRFLIRRERRSTLSRRLSEWIAGCTQSLPLRAEASLHLNDWETAAEILRAVDPAPSLALSEESLAALIDGILQHATKAQHQAVHQLLESENTALALLALGRLLKHPSLLTVDMLLPMLDLSLEDWLLFSKVLSALEMNGDAHTAPRLLKWSNNSQLSQDAQGLLQLTVARLTARHGALANQEGQVSLVANDTAGALTIDAAQGKVAVWATDSQD